MGFHCFPRGGRWAKWSPGLVGKPDTVAERKDSGRCAAVRLSPTRCRRTTLLSGAPGTHRSWDTAVRPLWSYGCRARRRILRVYTLTSTSSRYAPAGRVFHRLYVQYHGRWRRYPPIPRPSIPPPSSWHHQTGPPCTGPAPLSQNAEGEGGTTGAPRHSGHPVVPLREPGWGGLCQGPRTDGTKLKGGRQELKTSSE